MLQSFTKKAEEIMSDSTYVIQVSIGEAMMFYLMCICDFLYLCPSDESDPQSSTCGLLGIRTIEASVGSETRKHFLLRSPSSISFEKMVNYHGPVGQDEQIILPCWPFMQWAMGDWRQPHLGSDQWTVLLSIVNNLIFLAGAFLQHFEEVLQIGSENFFMQNILSSTDPWTLLPSCLSCVRFSTQLQYFTPNWMGC